MKLALLALFALSTTLLPLIMAAEQVVDTSGNAIFPGGRFYIMPNIFGAAGGGVKFGRTGNQICPVTVLQDYSEVIKGLPVKFAIKQDIGPGIIFTGTPLEISFEYKPGCAESSKWVVIDDLPAPYVAIGGAENHPGKIIIDGSFKIEKVGTFSYKLIFCPSITAPPGLCYDIGRYDDKHGRRLILTNKDAYELVFEDAGVVDEHYSIVA
ncbi:kunitz-type trypsin inhibitor-like 2 protein [Arachis ipaensis]|uniref:kunitz-type trypsin inhibitor-like 2 protein n=1 Tax=Arachis ipaensis TaxID=130454 RepID=UPI0007AF2FDA|nr:kunitz-type trypsin inhibitor-like 2 protein [Arachis ipaensis]QHO14022.1 Kunitz-type trypsin inhibitor-like 2 protein [Arachis hypogaea]